MLSANIFPASTCLRIKPTSASEDFGSFGAEWHAPSVFWFVGGTDPVAYARRPKKTARSVQIPTNHNPRFAPGDPSDTGDGRKGDGSRLTAWLAA